MIFLIFLNIIMKAYLSFLFLFFTSSGLIAQEHIPTLYAHRGGAYELDENTLSAFETSYNHGLRGFETDVHLTKDNQIVIIHDHTLDRTMQGSGTVENFTAAELKAIKTKNGNAILFLDEALEFFNQHPNLYVEFEMKTKTDHYNDAVLQKFADQLYQKVFKNKPNSSTYLITSFDKRPLSYLKKTYNTNDLLYITSQPLSDDVLNEAQNLGINRIGCNIGGTNRIAVKKAQEQGFVISVWPGKTIDDFVLGYSLGADYLCSDVPLQVYTFLKNKATWIKFK